MAHSHHDHHHTHGINDQKLNLAFIIGIGLNVAFVVIEVVYGLLLNSVALLSDAGHNFSDVISLLLGALAFYLLKVKPHKRYTYGLKKLTVFIAVLNSVLLFIAVGAIIFHSIDRVINPEPLQSVKIGIVAFIGIIINSVSAALFFSSRKGDINIRAVFWHLVADALVSVGVVIGAIIIKFTGAYWIDGVLGIIISVVILFSTWGLLRDSFLMLIDVAPREFEVENIRTWFMEFPWVDSVHHIHVWALSTTEYSLTAHVVVKDNYSLTELEEKKKQIKQMLASHNIRHSTIEFESVDFKCDHDYEC